MTEYVNNSCGTDFMADNKELSTTAKHQIRNVENLSVINTKVDHTAKSIFISVLYRKTLWIFPVTRRVIINTLTVD
jgi:hypothetical protein